MDEDKISVPYNHELKPLETLLAGVKRPGDFFVHGSVEVPMPRVEVEGVGVLSFPIPSAQIEEILKQADRAPYGRGEATIVDTSVRKVWQVTPAKVRLGGKSWASSFQHVLSTVTEGLGCAGIKVSAELYKLLVYDAGGFFLAHRDTEKAEGMFGTLVVVLPSAHRGGELVIRHADREITVDMSTAEVSELTFAAFYADCEHEVRPITEGNRVCLIYNLIQPPSGKKDKPLTAPLYGAEVAAAAKLLKEAFTETGAPTKLAWLLEHQYSPAGLSFAGLKGEDAALAKVLRQAAEHADCTVHLGIVHIEETGPAQPEYDSYRSSRRRYYRDDDFEEEEEPDTTTDSFEVIEVSDATRCVDQWRDTADRLMDFGKLPLADGEVLPAGALDDEDPDEQRLTEATGNEGATFERSYHRAALVLWPRDRFADVLLQAGVGAVMPYFKDRVAACPSDSASQAEREPVLSLAARIIEGWENAPGYSTYRTLGKEPDRCEMIDLLGRLGDAALLERFITGVVTRQYDGSENEALAARSQGLGAKKAGDALTRLVQENLRWFPSACVELLARLIRQHKPKPDSDWASGLRVIAEAMVAAVPKLEPLPNPHTSPDWQRVQKSKPVDATMVSELLDSLEALAAPDLRAAAVVAVVANTPMFDPAKVIVPALELMGKHGSAWLSGDLEGQRLWHHAAEFLLARSEHPPEPPRDWRQTVKISCACEDCRELLAFSLNPVEQIHRFRVRKERRQHLHGQIEHHGLDMTHVTDRKGSPQTLVCTKTRGTFQRQCGQHQADLASMTTLLHLARAARGEMTNLTQRLTAASERRP